MKLPLDSEGEKQVLEKLDTQFWVLCIGNLWNPMLPIAVSALSSQNHLGRPSLRWAKELEKFSAPCFLSLKRGIMQRWKSVWTT